MRFLIVDDDESVHLYLRKVLSAYAECECVLGGAESVEIFRKALDSGRPFDTVFMDILMPGMDGHAAVQKMREFEQKVGVSPSQEFKLVMITSLSDTQNVSKAFFKGYASCYIVKPFDKEKVLDELRANKIID